MKVILSRLAVAFSSLGVIGCAASDGGYPASMAHGQSSGGRTYEQAREYSYRVDASDSYPWTVNTRPQENWNRNRNINDAAR
ncbi:hypothetical protein DES53_101614 [Roseimicrobium gellanilyticum]|uniref:Lipoprotein n=1 Tax=Roseimicrobium gellanilyticum TaxID=748857 RepID=A0A366HW56_9BACT|nr:hypothetical protein [Roseimicrobium gellanilyticum]RBP47814.1 hypothetical protein DES53_101614 [Roseimicrobium gellanilyticum]